MSWKSPEAELTSHVGAGRYEPTKGWRGHRNGHYSRDLMTTYGPLRHLRLLEGGVDLPLFEKYQRRQSAVDTAIGQLFLQGISTRKLKTIARDLFGAPVSTGTVSKAAALLDADLQAYQTKPLADNNAFLFLDGISQKVQELGVEGKVMLCAFGIHRDGRKELLSFRLVDVEDTTTWRAFLVDLKSRGLRGKHLQLITVDGHPAPLKALREIYPLRRIQRCIAHKLRNVVVKLRKIRTTNILERAFREVRRRTRPMGVFTNAESAERIMYGVTKPLNANWEEHPLPEIQQNC